MNSTNQNYTYLLPFWGFCTCPFFVTWIWETYKETGLCWLMALVKVKGPHLVMAFLLAKSQGHAGHHTAEVEHVLVYAASDHFTFYKATNIQSWGLHPDDIIVRIKFPPSWCLTVGSDNNTWGTLGEHPQTIPTHSSNIMQSHPDNEILGNVTELEAWNMLARLGLLSHMVHHEKNASWIAAVLSSKSLESTSMEQTRTKLVV